MFKKIKKNSGFASENNITSGILHLACKAGSKVFVNDVVVEEFANEMAEPPLPESRCFGKLLLLH